MSLTDQVLEKCKTVRSVLPCGVSEIVFGNALFVEFLELQKSQFPSLKICREHTLPIIYKNVEVGTIRPDFMLSTDEKNEQHVLLVEIKAVQKSLDYFETQIMKYRHVSKFPVLIYNFGNGLYKCAP